MLNNHFSLHHQHFASTRRAPGRVAFSQAPNAMIPVEHFLRGLGVLVQRNFPVCPAFTSLNPRREEAKVGGGQRRRFGGGM